MGSYSDSDAPHHRKAEAGKAYRTAMRERGYTVVKVNDRSLTSQRIMYVHDACGAYVADGDKHDRYCLALREV